MLSENKTEFSLSGLLGPGEGEEPCPWKCSAVGTFPWRAQR